MLDIPPTLHEILAGRYVLKRELGRGGAATVYLAHDVRHERLVAIKVLHPELSHALGAQRFLREIKLTASLQHPHILPIHDSGEAEERLYYVMPYVEGESLRQRLGADNRLSLDDAVRVGREVAGALAYAHERGVVHRDIKPENILFSGGHAVLADFGIARAINRAHEKITHQGTITGTPAYMSPEQARDHAFDGRSDVYSLACVLYEAIAGVPPFVGDTPQLLLSQRISRTAPLLREFRHDVPTPIETVVAKALSISPDDRYDDARAFSAALSAAIGNSGETLSARHMRRPLRQNPWVWAAGVTLVVVAGGAGTTPRARDQIGLLAGRVDTTQYAIVPFQYVGTRAPAPELEPVSQGLYAAMREWDGLKLASDVSVQDLIQKRPESSLAGMRGVARGVRAGKLVWGRVWLTRDSVRVRAALYDAVEGTPLREVTVSGTRDQLLAGAGGLSGLAAELLRLDGVRGPLRSADVGTRSLPAWRAYEEGQRALANWRVPMAIAALERAVAVDPAFAQAHLWLSQLLVWRSAPASEWNAHLSAALRKGASLGAREASVMSALQAMQRGDMAGSCRAYSAMRGTDSLDATAWLGLSYCEGLNRRVIRSARSATGWAFEGNSSVAQRAYAQAMRLAPTAFDAFTFDVINQIFIVESNRLRYGRRADSSYFFAYPDIVADTLALVPRPLADITATPTRVAAPHYDLALSRTREALLGLLSTLIQRLPDDPDAFEALAQTLELRDDITGTPNGGYSALSALERAKGLATDSVQRARLGAADVRLHLKLGDFSRAAALGDSILRASPNSGGGVAAYLMGVAALLGREHDAVNYISRSGSSMADAALMITAAGPAAGGAVPILEDVSAAFFMRTALGVCDDSVRVLRTRMTTLMESYVSPSRLPLVRDAMMQRPLNFAVGCFGPAPLLQIGQPMPTTRIQQSLAHNDFAGARRQLDSLQRAHRQLRPGEYALDYTVTEAWMQAVLGDTAAAIRQLDLTLTALPTLQTRVVYEPGMAAAVGRSMVMRAELAAKRGDRGSAALWASRVLTLWTHADPSLAPTLARMKQLAAQEH
ncbi:MAG: protein kinase [Gemmatimonadota bacterium]|nr:protein kinase [Gemmatimonadota bacterium]